MYAAMPARRAALALVVAVAVTLATPVAADTGFSDAWRAAQRADATLAVARAARDAVAPRADEAAGLWRPTVTARATAGLATAEQSTRGARFATPAFGESTGVAFDTSTVGGAATRWAVTARAPLVSADLTARARQLGLSVDQATIEWQAARDDALLRLAERYLGAALAQESLAVVETQLGAVTRTATEVQDRFRLGDVPVTDTLEARARLAALRAQRAAADGERSVQRHGLAVLVGTPEPALAPRLPTGRTLPPPPPLAEALAQAERAHAPVRARELAIAVARAEAERWAPGRGWSVDVVAEAGRDRIAGSGAFGGGASFAVSQQLVGVQVSVPLYTGGVREARRAEAVLQVARAEAELAQAREAAREQARAAWTRLSAAGERLTALEDAASASAARLEATRLGQQVGDRTTQQLLDAELAAAEARLAVAQARVAWWLDRLRLAAVTGTLDEGLERALDADAAPRP